MRSRVKNIFVLLFGVVVLVGCSTTKRIADGEQLYTGVKKIKVTSMTDDEVPSYVESAATEPFMVKPNNPLWSPYVRSPLPTGLWAYNQYNEKGKGFSHWLFRKFAKEPVLVSKLKLDVRMKMVEDILDNHGYFNSTANYEVLPQRNPKKARISYNVKVAEPWTYSRVSFPEAICPVSSEICEIEDKSLIKVGKQYNIDTLNAERIRITNHLRDKSYYYFRPHYIEYLADTTKGVREVDLKMVLSKGLPSAVRRPYKVGNVRLELYSARGSREADSLNLDGIDFWYEKPLKYRKRYIKRAITVRSGDDASLSTMSRTLQNLSRQGIFSYVNMEVTPLDSLKGSDYLDVLIKGRFDAPINVSLELDFASKSNSFIGPGLIFGIKHKNFFRGAETFGIDFNGNYEWQTGNQRSSANATSINSYEFGVNASLSVPRLLVPKSMQSKKPYDRRTLFGLGANILNRPKFFRMLEFNLSTAYEFQTSKRSYHSITPFKLVYSNLLSKTDEFNKVLDQNKAIRKSFESQFIPSLSYTYTYNRGAGRTGANDMVWQSTVTAAGNVFYGVYELFGYKGEKKLMGAPFSQFIKGQTEFKYYKRLGRSTLVFRTLMGAAHPYGNSTVIPYSEQFYIGGANSIRAFTIRSLGPGSYKPNEDEMYGYFDQTGDLKFEANIEYRFPLMGALHGALFLDAGNIWLLRNDPERPGGQFKAKNFFKELATGTGFGLRVDVKFLVIRADFGIGLHTPYKNPKKSGYYNIGRFKDGVGFHFAVGYPF